MHIYKHVKIIVIHFCVLCVSFATDHTKNDCDQYCANGPSYNSLLTRSIMSYYVHAESSKIFEHLLPRHSGQFITQDGIDDALILSAKLHKKVCLKKILSPSLLIRPTQSACEIVLHQALIDHDEWTLRCVMNSGLYILTYDIASLSIKYCIKNNDTGCLRVFFEQKLLWGLWKQTDFTEWENCLEKQPLPTTVKFKHNPINVLLKQFITERQSDSL